MSLETIRTLKIPLPNGRSVPLSELASVEYEQDLPLIWRRDRLPTLTVQAEPRDGVLAATAVAGLSEKISELKRQLPVGYKIVEGGSVEESAKGQSSVLAVFPIVVVLMITVLMFQMQSFSRLFLVCSVAPLGVIGVVLALLVTQSPMGFVAMLGTVALVGMIIRNSVIMVDQIEVEKEAGRGGWDAVVEASLVRFRPIITDRAGDDPGHGADRADRLLGPHGLRHHGRARGGHRADADLAAVALHHLVQNPARRRTDHSDRRLDASSGRSSGLINRVTHLRYALIYRQAHGQHQDRDSRRRFCRAVFGPAFREDDRRRSNGRSDSREP